MSSITGGTLVDGGAVVGAATGVRPGSTEERVLDAVVACAGRWGIAKTTVDDVAREAGVSRATVYRLFPGGKPAMVHLTTNREVVAMLVGLTARLEQCTDLVDALTTMLSEGTRVVASQPAIAYMQAHEPASLRAFFSFDRLDKLFGVTADVLSPTLHRILTPRDARAAVIWCARLVVSHYLRPDEAVDLSDRSCAAVIVEAFMAPGFDAGHADPSSPTSPTHQEYNHEHQ